MQRLAKITNKNFYLYLFSFVGEWQLVSCSDDRTAALWDVRQLSDHQGSRPLHRFQHGHRGWLKNVEYLPNSQTLITAGFDNMVKAWPMPELKYETQLDIL